MCGTVGMFVGCSAVAYCPVRGPLAARRGSDSGQPAAADGEQPTEEYRSPFRSWYERASVRQTPRRVLAEDRRPGRFFAPDLVPVAGHPLVRKLPDDVFERLLVQHLYRYLDFTAKLEHLVVNRTVLGIAHGTVGIVLPEEMRLDAYKIYCDEAYHALFSADLLWQVRAATGIDPQLPPQPYFLRRLGALQRAAPGQLRPLVELLFVVVSETLISATLTQAVEDHEVSEAVRNTLQDHALDEGRHHTYFATFLRLLWQQLDRPTRQAAAPLVPELIDCFLRPDLVPIRLELRGYGLAADEVEQVIEEVLPTSAVTSFGRSASRQTLRYFSVLGALDDPRARAGLEQRGLL